jgi:predicted PurR-regulated permease PerM
VDTLLAASSFIAFFMLRDGWRFREFLIRSVPNAYFERSLYLMEQVDRTARLYFVGLIELTMLDTLCLAGGLWLIGIFRGIAAGFACGRAGVDSICWVGYWLLSCRAGRCYRFLW